jgi:hypothetical protein
MNGLRRLGQKFRYGLQRFMEGRYGTDKLNMAILCAACAIVLIYTFFVPEGPVRLALWAVSYALMVWAICRTLSRNTYKRYEENRKFLRFLEQLKDRDHRYFDCPRCRQRVRVPRGKGKISISCPKCHEKFVKKT